ncbi:hypothetical protein V7S43_002446 [Phytophthora oleae]|uniref:Uncharacterized protein n=1 Tax=Phytophthora oleae TaxID=2107226 RepID=A0ABD3G5D7_9STRA
MSHEDVGGTHEVEGILTYSGGMKSRAAVMTRGGKPLRVRLSIDSNAKTMRVATAGGDLHQGDYVYISVNGMTGEVIKVEQALQKAAKSGDLVDAVGGRAPRRIRVFMSQEISVRSTRRTLAWSTCIEKETLGEKPRALPCRYHQLVGPATPRVPGAQGQRA